MTNGKQAANQGENPPIPPPYRSYAPIIKLTLQPGNALGPHHDYNGWVIQLLLELGDDLEPRAPQIPKDLGSYRPQRALFDSTLRAR